MSTRTRRLTLSAIILAGLVATIPTYHAIVWAASLKSNSDGANTAMMVVICGFVLTEIGLFLAALYVTAKYERTTDAQ